MSATVIPLRSRPTDITRYHAIPRVVIVFRPESGPAVDFETDRSNVLFARLREAACSGETITHFSADGADLDADSISALNSFLRGQRAMGRMRHPWDRIPHASAADTRYEWAQLVRHLGLSFR